MNIRTYVRISSHVLIMYIRNFVIFRNKEIIFPDSEIMYVRMYSMCVIVRTYVRTYIHTIHIHTFIHIRIYVCILMYVFIHVCVLLNRTARCIPQQC